MNPKKKTQKQQARAPFASGPAAPKASRGRTTTTGTPFQLRAHGFELDAPLRAHVQKRVGSKLGRYGLALNRVVVRFERPSGTKGSPAFACRFSLTTANSGKVVVEAVEADAKAAFDAAVDGAERAVRRLLEKAREAPRGAKKRAARAKKG